MPVLDTGILFPTPEKDTRVKPAYDEVWCHNIPFESMCDEIFAPLPNGITPAKAGVPLRVWHER